MNELICRAIREHRVIEFYYDGGLRTAEPHCYGVSRQGNELLRAYQTAGYSESGQVVGWKLLRMDQLSQLVLAAERFADPRPQYNPNDKAMASVYCCL
jgi:hypothetical protein